MTYKYGQIDQHDCLYNLARQYPGGLEAMAPRMGMTAKLLRKKLTPGEKANQASWEDASVVMELCDGAGVPDALQPLQAMAFRHGMICFPIPETADLSEEALGAAAMRVMVQLGEAIAASSDAMSDGHLSEQELQEIEPKIRRMLPSICAWLERLRHRAKADACSRVLSKILHPRREKTAVK